MSEQGLTIPVATRGNLKDLLEKNKDAIAAVVPAYLTAERLLKVVMLTAMANPDILECTKESILKSVMISAQMGIEIGPQSGHLVPFNKKVRERNGVPEHWVKEVQFIPDYRGLIGQAKRCGAITKAEAHLVYKDDQFEVDWGADKPLTHKPNFMSPNRKPEDVVAAYFRAKLPDGDYQYDIMTKVELDAIKERSKAKSFGPWVTDPGEMYRKTISKRGLKYIPNLDDRVIAAIEHDNRIESGDLGAVGLLTDTEESVAAAVEDTAPPTKASKVAETVAAVKAKAEPPTPTPAAVVMPAPVEPPKPAAPARAVTTTAAPRTPPWAAKTTPIQPETPTQQQPSELENEVAQMVAASAPAPTAPPRKKPKTPVIKDIAMPEFADRASEAEAWTQEQYNRAVDAMDRIPGSQGEAQLQSTVLAWIGLPIEQINAETLETLTMVLETKFVPQG